MMRDHLDTRRLSELLSQYLAVPGVREKSMVLSLRVSTPDPTGEE
jgi:hypothetical protein